MTESKVTLEELLVRKRRCDARLQELQDRVFSNYSTEAMDTDAVYDMYIMDQYVYVDINLPGVLRKNFEIQITPPYLKVVGQHPPVIETAGITYLERKRKVGPFAYTFMLPSSSVITEYDSQLENGILYLKLRLKGVIEQKKLPQAS